MVTMSRVHYFVAGYLKFPVAFNAESELIESEKSLKKTVIKSSRSEDLLHVSDEVTKLSNAGKGRRQYRVILASLS